MKLTVKLRNALRVRDLEVENKDLRVAVDALRAKVSVVGDSDQMRRILERVSQVSQSPARDMASRTLGKKAGSPMARKCGLSSDSLVL